MGKVAVITGGSSGIGYAIAKMLVKDHFSLALIARNQEGLDKARDELLTGASSDIAIKTYAIDVVNEADVVRTLNNVIDSFGKIDWLVTSAGYSKPGYFEDQSTEIFQRTFDVNFFGTLHFIRHVLPGMKRRKQGKIVFISSGAGKLGIFGSSAYSSSKFALSGLAETLRSECKPYHVQISIAFPPDTDTPLMKKNDSLKPWETKVLMEQGGLYSPDRVAGSIYRGVKMGKYAITTGFQMLLVVRLKSLIYPYIFRRFDKKLKKGRDKRK